MQIIRTASIKTLTETDMIPNKQGVRWGDIITLELFIAYLKDIFRKLDWEEEGIKIRDEHISNLTF